MRSYKKTAAFIVSVITAVSAMAPAVSAFADDEDELIATPYVLENEDDTDEGDAAGNDDIMLINDIEEEQIFTSGDYSYRLDDDGNAIITACTAGSEELALPDTLDGKPVTEIDASASFKAGIKKIIVPASVIYISAENPFVYCLTLNEIEVDPANTEYSSKDGILFSKDLKKLICVPPSKNLGKYTVPDGVEEIGIAAIYENNVEEITLPESVTTLDRHCFSFNSSLKKVDMSRSAVKDIPIMAFVECKELTDVTFPNALTSIDLGGFMNCAALEKIDLPDTLKSVGQNAFMGCAMTEVVVPVSVTDIGYSAFGYKSSEVAVSGFTIIGEYGSAAYKYCTDADTEYDYKNEFDFMTYAAYEKKLEYDSLDTQSYDDYTYIVENGEVCIVTCTSYTNELEVPSEILGMPVTSIYHDAFQSCSSLKITLPETVKTIGDMPFSQYLEELVIPGGCTDIDSAEPFICCTALKSITVTEGDGSFSSENGVLYNKDKTMLLAYPQAKEDKTLVLPNTVREIGSSSCCYNEYLEEVDLSFVENIGNYAFEGCSALKNVKLSKDLKLVGHNAFLGCVAMDSVRVYDKLEAIGDYAFGYIYDDELAEAIAETGDDQLAYSVKEGFKMYVEKDSLAHQYAEACGIEAVLGTVALGDKNVDRNFIFVILGIIGALILVVIGVLTGKRISRSKKEKSADKKKKEKSDEDK